MSTIISSPLDFPVIEPDNWQDWWEVWKAEAVYAEKINQSHNTTLVSPWVGFDVYVKPGKEDLATYHYNFKNINRPDLFQKFFSNLENFPIDISIMRAVSTFGPVVPHNDFTKPTYSVRAMLYDENPKQTWYYLFDDKKKYLTIPKNTNSWIYPDHESKHGTDFQDPYKKILLLFFGSLKPGYPEKAFEQSMTKYKEYIITK